MVRMGGGVSTLVSSKWCLDVYLEAALPNNSDSNCNSVVRILGSKQRHSFVL